jgi:hypothetical protein
MEARDEGERLMSGDSGDKDGGASGENVTGGEGAAQKSAATGNSPLADVAAAFAQALLDTANDTDPERARQREERQSERDARIARLLRAHQGGSKQR